MGPPAAAAAVLITLSVLRFVFPDTQGIMLLAVIPIALLGAMLGVWGGLIAAVYASAVVLIWAGTSGDADTLEYVDEPVTFFLLGSISGFFAQGTLGNYDLRSARVCGELRRALEHEQVELHYQPIVRTSDRSLIGIEALARWRHPRRGLIPPSDFIPLAEGDRRTIWELTLSTVEIAAREARELAGTPKAFISVNLSPVSLRNPELAGSVGQILDQVGLHPSRIGFEVTEGAIADGEETVVAGLGELRELGVAMIAVDDFGIGYSSLGRLARLPIDALKIDRALIAHGDASGRAITRGIVGLGHAIALTVIAEGVEDQETMDALGDMHCDAIQGFHVSRPQPAEDLAGWLVAADDRR